MIQTKIESGDDGNIFLLNIDVATMNGSQISYKNVSEESLPLRWVY